jgi:D-alanyl-D-alanine carboxypeptidase (penicillin-binding protein 5/6)
MIKLKKWLYLLGILVILVLLPVVPALAQPYVSASHYCLIDSTNGQIILAQEADERRPVASTTKMMTAILAVEYCDLHEIAEVSPNADQTPEYTIGLRAGQKISVEELLKISLIRSANDAAVVLAEHIAGDERFFGHLMSKKAWVIGATNTHFVNASGLPHDEHYSSAYDLTIIGRYLLANDYLSRLVATKETEFKHPGYKQPMIINNTNSLLRTYPGADGIKTGTTNAAGKCLIASATRNGRQLIAVSLKSQDRFGDCARLLNYGFKSSPTLIIDKNVPFKELRINNGNSSHIKIYPAEDVYIWQVEGNPKIERKVEMQYLIECPCHRF